MENRRLLEKSVESETQKRNNPAKTIWVKELLLKSNSLRHQATRNKGKGKTSSNISAAMLVPPSKNGKMDIRASKIEAAEIFANMANSVYQKFGKGFLDLILASLLLIILWPIFLCVGLMIKLDSHGSVIFRQKRVGKDGKIFVIYKFRTMIENAEKMQDKYRSLNEVDGPVFKIKDDPRYTKFGKFLSHTGLDELPQLLNIIKGEMSFVGPRPLPVDEEKYIPLRWRTIRRSTKPGITSSWLISGAHGLTFNQWLQHDVDDIAKSCLPFDLYKIWDTFLFMLRFISNELTND